MIPLSRRHNANSALRHRAMDDMPTLIEVVPLVEVHLMAWEDSQVRAGISMRCFVSRYVVLVRVVRPEA
jgi:hypothetical protein